MSSIPPWDSSGIHSTAVIHPQAELHPSVTVGPHSVIGPHVQIGDGTTVGPNVVIDGWTTIGEHNRIFPGAVIGMEPQDLKYNGAPSRVAIGNHNRIRECVTIHRATREGESTVIGDQNLLMAYVHVAHNCVIADQVIISNSVGLAGHVQIESRAVLGGMAGIHQFTHIGQLAMVGAMSRIDRDVPPYLRVEGHPGRIRGLNPVGLKRASFSPEAISLLKRAYRILYRSGLPLEKAVQTLRHWPEMLSEGEGFRPLNHLLNFLEDSLNQDHRRGLLPVYRQGRSVDED